MIPVSLTESLPAQRPTKDVKLFEVAKKLEATFLAEMLKAAGFGEARDSFGGGQGEDKFTSFLVREQANAMTEAGGIGLAESLYKSLKEQR
ncbi:MAG: rod-binding protein [Roseobacter sp.]